MTSKFHMADVLLAGAAVAMLAILLPAGIDTRSSHGSRSAYVAPASAPATLIRVRGNAGAVDTPAAIDLASIATPRTR